MKNFIENKITYIYTLSAKSDINDIKYVGKADNPNERLKRHKQNYYLKENSLKNNWIKHLLKIGDDIHMEIIDIVDEKEWNFWETYWIFQFKMWGFNLKNGTYGGDGFYLISTDIINRRNKTNSGKILSEETKNKISKSKKGSIVSQETRNKISKKLIGTKASEETKNKLSEMRSGSGNTFYNKIHTDKSLEKMKMNHPFRKEVIQYDIKGNIIKEYNSVGEAALLTGFKKSHIIKNCNKKKSSFLVGGFVFRYKNELFDYNSYIPYNIKKVSQYDKNGNYLNTFSSIVEAAKFLKLKRWNGISTCCKGKLKSAYGYIWKYD